MKWNYFPYLKASIERNSFTKCSFLQELKFYFQNRKRNHSNMKWNYFTCIQDYDKNLFCRMFLIFTKESNFKTGNGIRFFHFRTLDQELLVQKVSHFQNNFQRTCQKMMNIERSVLYQNFNPRVAVLGAFCIFLFV